VLSATRLSASDSTAAARPQNIESRNQRLFREELGSRLRRGSHLILYGPRGAGKSTLLRGLLDDNHAVGTPCGLCQITSGLADIVDALEQAYPRTDVAGLNRRATRARLRNAADRDAGVLLLDHVTGVTSAALGCLRRLRGGIAGALLVADIDTTHERERLRGWHVGALSIRMPPFADRLIHQRLLTAIQASQLPPIPPQLSLQVAHAARGRIGWLERCICRLERQEYWVDGRLHSAALCTDTEIELRESRPGPRMSGRVGEG
jgi:predicted ATPase